jgi:cysteinyl-tRNA synthetase
MFNFFKKANVPENFQDNHPINRVNNFACYINNTHKEKVISSNYDLIIIDTCDPDGKLFTAKDLYEMKQREGKDDKLLIGYVSLGEAESYRWYWQKQWKKNPPKWLGRENKEWPGNYPVHFWTEEWWEITKQILDKVLAQDFDGIFIDKVDVYNDLGGDDHLANSMRDFIVKVSQYVRSKKSDFILLSSNAAELAIFDDRSADYPYLDAWDGIVREDLWFTSDGSGVMPGTKQAAKEVNSAVDDLNIWKNAGKKVFVIDYVTGRQWIWARDKIKRLGFIGYCSDRGLVELRENVWA